MEILTLLIIVLSAPTLFALYRLIQRKRAYKKAMDHWNKLQRRIDNGRSD